jgi:hypothetical protein
MSALALMLFAPVLSAQAITYEDLGNDEVVGDFVVGPGKVELDIKPGESKTVNLLISNRMGDERVFNLDVEDIRGSDDPETPVVLLGSDKGPYSLRDYVSFDQSSFDLPHATRAVVPVTISIPADAEPGGYYGSVLVSTASKPNDASGAEGAAHVISRIGVLFFVRVPGDVKEEGKMVQFDTTAGKHLFASGPISFGISFQNTGNVHLNPYGEIRVKNIFGEEVGFVEVVPWFALPNSLRFREVVWNRDHLFGIYTAEARINRGYDNIVDTSSVTFVIVPWKSILVAFAVLAAVIFALRFIATRFEFKRKSNKRK